ncbi:AIPR family protein [Rothia terrae]|uniref:AIPR family protein n=1 Tax=Rothia terrae TaxID=396015 RepID=UPI00340976E1
MAGSSSMKFQPLIKSRKKNMDVLVKGIVENFAKEYGFEGSLEQLFEKYVAWVYLQEYHKQDPAVIDAIVTGGGGDEGIDVAAVVINRNIVTDPSEVEENISDQFKNTLKVLLIQAKTSQGYDAKLISKFLHGVETITDCLSHTESKVAIPSALKTTVDILKKSLEFITKFDTFHIPAEMYYVTTAAHARDDAKKDSQVSRAIKRIQDSGMFQSEIDLNLHGKSEIQKTKEFIGGPKNVIIHFPRKQSIPATEGINQAFIGVISATEIIKLISENGMLRENIFDDNVRLYQGERNDVNRNIQETLASDQKNKFPFLNNGITLVARKVDLRSEDLTISNYSIINGCQTSNEIFNWWVNLDHDDIHIEDSAKNIFVPLKIIETESDEILSEITISANRQTPIKDTDIQSSSKIAKQVEEYFEQTGKDGMRYRRQSVFDKDYDVAKLRIVDTQSLNRAIASCIFGDASLAAGSPTQLIRKNSYMWKEYPESIYFFAAKTAYQIDRHLTNNGKTNIRAAKWHISFIVSRLTFPEIAPITPLKNDANFPTEYKKILKKVGDKVHSSKKWQTNLDTQIGRAVAIVEDVFKEKLEESGNLVKDDVRTQKVQETIAQKLQELDNIDS